MGRTGYVVRVSVCMCVAVNQHGCSSVYVSVSKKKLLKMKQRVKKLQDVRLVLVV